MTFYLHSKIISALIFTTIIVITIIQPIRGTSVNCPGSQATCDGCQCCPNGCLCPNAVGCKPHLCPNEGPDCGTTTSTVTSTTMHYTTTTNVRPANTTTSPTVVTTTNTATGHSTTTSVKPGQLIFEDNFDTLDFSKWKHELTLGGGGNWEFEMYHNNRSTSYTRDGILYIKPGLMSDFLGGEQFVKTATQMDIWGSAPADVCTGNFDYGNWPASGEIDIMESRGNIQYPLSSGGGLESFGSTLHFGPAWNADPFQKTHKIYTKKGGDLHDDFHVYGCVWSPDRIYTYIDDPDNVVLDVPIEKDFWTLGDFPSTYENPWRQSGKNAPFDKEYYLVMNVAVGGTSGYFPDGVGGKPWTNSDPHSVNAFYNAKNEWYSSWDKTGENSALQVDYVKVWAL